MKRWKAGSDAVPLGPSRASEGLPPSSHGRKFARSPGPRAKGVSPPPRRRILDSGGPEASTLAAPAGRMPLPAKRRADRRRRGPPPRPRSWTAQRPSERRRPGRSPGPEGRNAGRPGRRKESDATQRFAPEGMPFRGRRSEGQREHHLDRHPSTRRGSGRRPRPPSGRRAERLNCPSTGRPTGRSSTSSFALSWGEEPIFSTTRRLRRLPRRGLCRRQACAQPPRRFRRLGRQRDLL